MVSSVFAEKIQPQLLLVQKIARNIALLLLLVSVVIPFSYQVIYAQAQSNNAINPNTKVTVEKVMKDNTKEIKEVTLAELNTDKELVNFTKFNQTEETRQLNLTTEKIEQIESGQGVLYENGVAILNTPVLTTLGYEPEQIILIQNMVDFYNSQTVKEIKVTTDRLDVAKNQFSLFSIQAHAGCQYEYSTTWHFWGIRNWVNNCVIQDLKVYGFSSAGLAAIFGGFPGQITGFITGLYIELIDAANSRCDNRGAYLDKPFVGPLLINNVC